MKYFYIGNSFDRTVIGKFPQSSVMGCGYNHLVHNSIDHVVPNIIPVFEPATGCFVLDAKAKITDFISAAIVSTGFIVSDKAMQVLGQFNLGLHRFYPTAIAYKNANFTNYFWFLYRSEMKPYLDYSKMDFYITDIDGVKKKKLPKIHSEKDFAKTLENTDFSEKIVADKVYFNNRFPKDLDLFRIPLFNYSTYISERLYSSLVENKISGLQLKESGWFG